MAEVNLSKVPRVNLSKNQVVNLTKTGEESSDKLSVVYVGANWGAIKKIRKVSSSKPGFFSRLFGATESTEDILSVESVDLDASILMYDSDYNNVETVFFNHKVSNDGSIKHSGDDLTGDTGEEDDDDNEVISINLNKVSKNVRYLVAILNSYSHQKFDEIPYIRLRIFTGKGPKDVKDILASYKLDNNPEFKRKESIILGYFYRTDQGWWKFKADGTSTDERSIQSIANGSALRVIRNG